MGIFGLIAHDVVIFALRLTLMAVLSIKACSEAHEVTGSAASRRC